MPVTGSHRSTLDDLSKCQLELHIDQNNIEQQCHRETSHADQSALHQVNGITRNE